MGGGGGAGGCGTTAADQFSHVVASSPFHVPAMAPRQYYQYHPQLFSIMQSLNHQAAASVINSSFIDSETARKPSPAPSVFTDMHTVEQQPVYINRYYNPSGDSKISSVDPVPFEHVEPEDGDCSNSCKKDVVKNEINRRVISDF